MDQINKRNGESPLHSLIYKSKPPLSRSHSNYRRLKGLIIPIFHNSEIGRDAEIHTLMTHAQNLNNYISLRLSKFHHKYLAKVMHLVGNLLKPCTWQNKLQTLISWLCSCRVFWDSRWMKDVQNKGSGWRIVKFS